MLDRAQIKNAIDAGGGHAQAGAELGAPLVHDSRRAAEAASERSVCARRATGAASTSAGSPRPPTPTTGRGRPPTRGSATSGSTNGNRFLLKEAVETAGDLLLGSAVMEREKGWNLLCKFFDNMGPDSPSHAPDRRAGEAPRPQGKARGVLLPSAVQQDRQQLSPHVHGARAGHDQGGRAALPRELEQGRQRHPLPLAGLPARARHRAGRSIRASSMRRGRSSPTSRRSRATCSRCSSPRSRDASRPGR